MFNLKDIRVKLVLVFTCVIVAYVCHKSGVERAMNRLVSQGYQDVEITGTRFFNTCFAPKGSVVSEFKAVKQGQPVTGYVCPSWSAADIIEDKVK